jgi:uncharacterized protein (TIGR00369 family)
VRGCHVVPGNDYAAFSPIYRDMDYITRIRRNGRNANPFFVSMGIEVVSFENGRAVLRMPVRPDMMNGEQYLQGGLYTALADEAIVLALYSGLAEGESVATISESTSFLAGVQTGVVIAEGRIVRKGRRVAFGEGDLTMEDDGRLLSRTSAAYAIKGRTQG